MELVSKTQVSIKNLREKKSMQKFAEKSLTVIFMANLLTQLNVLCVVECGLLFSTSL